MTSATLNPTVLAPLFAPWLEPNSHRVRAEKASGKIKNSGQSAAIATVIKPSYSVYLSQRILDLPIAPNKLL
jgi:hypothetical protein